MAISFHKNNIHKNGYDFDLLVEKHPTLKQFLVTKHSKTTINFSDPKAVKELNSALLKTYYKINFWDFPDDNLCPPIPGRVDYIHYLSELTEEIEVTVLDIGTGATCIYPLLGTSTYNWSFVATDISKDSLQNAQKIIDKNQLSSKIQLRHQPKKEHILQGVVKDSDRFIFTMCNPPFYKSREEAVQVNQRKNKNLQLGNTRNFSGTSNELWYKGGEKAFLHTYLYESSLLPTMSKWYTSLVANKDNVKSLNASAKKLGVKEFKVIPMHQGNKVTRIVCWRFV